MSEGHPWTGSIIQLSARRDTHFDLSHITIFPITLFEKFALPKDRSNS